MREVLIRAVPAPARQSAFVAVRPPRPGVARGSGTRTHGTVTGDSRPREIQRPTRPATTRGSPENTASARHAARDTPSTPDPASHTPPARTLDNRRPRHGTHGARDTRG